MTAWNYTKGLHKTGAGNDSYLQPVGNWSRSNSDLIVDGGESLLADTLFGEYSVDTSPPNTLEIFALMAEIKRTNH